MREKEGGNGERGESTIVRLGEGKEREREGERERNNERGTDV